MKLIRGPFRPPRRIIVLCALPPCHFACRSRINIGDYIYSRSILKDFFSLKKGSVSSSKCIDDSNFNSKSRNVFKNFLDISLSLDRSNDRFRARFVPAFDSLFLSLCSNRWYPVAQFDRLILEHSAGSFMLVTQRVLKGQLFFTTATNSEKRDAMNDKKRSGGEGGRRVKKRRGEGGKNGKGRMNF